MTRPLQSPSRRDGTLSRPSMLLLLLVCLSFTAHAATLSKKYQLEKNRPMGLDLAAGKVRAEQVIFEFPGSVLRLETAGKARVTVVNGSAGKVRVGLALALYDESGNLVAAGTGGNKGGQVAPGETVEFSIFFYYVTEQLSTASSFQITLEAK